MHTYSPTVSILQERQPLQTGSGTNLGLVTSLWLNVHLSICLSSQGAGYLQHEGREQQPFSYWYQGVFRTQWRVKPASVRILMEAASASLTVSLTDCIKFWALWTNISVACQRGNSAMKSRNHPSMFEPRLHWEKRTHLLWLLFTDVGTTQHGGLDRGQNFELSADGGNTLTHLNESQEAKLKQRIMTF